MVFKSLASTNEDYLHYPIIERQSRLKVTVIAPSIAKVQQSFHNKIGSRKIIFCSFIVAVMSKI